MRCATASRYPVDWLAIIFNPSFPYRFAHMLTAAYLTTSLVVLAVGARYLLAGRHGEEAAPCCTWESACWRCSRRSRLFIGDQHGLNTLEHQPIKIAAIEAHWDGSKPGELVLFAWPDEKTEIEPLSDCDSARRLAHPHALIRRPVSRPEERAAQRPAAGRAGVLRLPHHGRHRASC